jgi:hypothetical protein
MKKGEVTIIAFADFPELLIPLTILLPFDTVDYITYYNFDFAKTINVCWTKETWSGINMQSTF